MKSRGRLAEEDDHSVNIIRDIKLSIKRSLIHDIGGSLTFISYFTKTHKSREFISRIPSPHYFATDRRSAFLRSNDRIFSSLEGIACISLGKFVNNRVNADCVRLQTLFTLRDTVLARSRIQFGRKARTTESRDHLLTRRISFWFITKLSFSLIPLLWQCQWRSQCTSARINLIGDICIRVQIMLRIRKSWFKREHVTRSRYAFDRDATGWYFRLSILKL